MEEGMGDLKELLRGYLGVCGREGSEKGIKRTRGSVQTWTWTLAFAVMHYVEYNRQLSGCCTTAKWKIYIREIHGVH